MSPLEKIAKTRNELLARLRPHLKPSERQRQIKQDDDLRSRAFERRFGEWRIWVIAGGIALPGSLGVPNSVTTKPLIVLTALGFISYGIYKRYFPSEPPSDEPSPADIEQLPTAPVAISAQDEEAAARASAERYKKRLMAGWEWTAPDPATPETEPSAPARPRSP